MWKNILLPVLGIILAVGIVVGVKCFMRNNLLFVEIYQKCVDKIDCYKVCLPRKHIEFLRETSVRLT